MHQKKLLITGLNGLIGWHLYQNAKDRFRIFGTYAKTHPALEQENLYRMDLDDPVQVGRLLKDIQPDYVIHARGICDLDLCESLPEMADHINATGTSKLLQCLLKEVPGLRPESAIHRRISASVSQHEYARKESPGVLYFPEHSHRSPDPDG